MLYVMKRFYALIAIAVAISFSACQQKEEMSTSHGDVISVTLSAGNPEVVTKTTLVGGVPYWSADDAIGVSDGNSNHRFDNDAEEQSAKTTFSGQTAVAGKLYAYYPYSSSKQISGAKVNLDVLPSQMPDVDSFDSSSDIMVAKPFSLDAESKTANLQFARLGAVVKVVLTDLSGELSSDFVQSVSLTSASPLAGSLPIDLAAQKIGDVVNGENTVTANYSSGYQINGSNAAWFVVIPQTIAEGESLTLIVNTDKHNITKTLTAPVNGIEILQGVVTTLNVKITAADVPYMAYESADPMGIHWSGCNATIKVNSNIDWTVTSDNSVAVATKDANGNVNVKMPAITKFTNVVANITIAPVDQTLGIAPQTKTLTQKPLMKAGANAVVNSDGSMTLTGAASTMARMASAEKFKLCNYTFKVKDANLQEGTYYHINTWGANNMIYQITIGVNRGTLTSSGNTGAGTSFWQNAVNFATASGMPQTLEQLNSIKEIKVQIRPYTGSNWNDKLRIQVWIDGVEVMKNEARVNPWMPGTSYTGLDTYIGIYGPGSVTIESFSFTELSQNM